MVALLSAAPYGAGAGLIAFVRLCDRSLNLLMPFYWHSHLLTDWFAVLVGRLFDLPALLPVGLMTLVQRRLSGLCRKVDSNSLLSGMWYFSCSSVSLHGIVSKLCDSGS